MQASEEHLLEEICTGVPAHTSSLSHDAHLKREDKNIRNLKKTNRGWKGVNVSPSQTSGENLAGEFLYRISSHASSHRTRVSLPTVELCFSSGDIFAHFQTLISSFDLDCDQDTQRHLTAGDSCPRSSHTLVGEVIQNTCAYAWKSVWLFSGDEKSTTCREDYPDLHTWL